MSRSPSVAPIAAAETSAGRLSGCERSWRRKNRRAAAGLAGISFLCWAQAKNSLSAWPCGCAHHDFTKKQKCSSLFYRLVGTRFIYLAQREAVPQTATHQRVHCFATGQPNIGCNTLEQKSCSIVVATRIMGCGG